MHPEISTDFTSVYALWEQFDIIAISKCMSVGLSLLVQVWTGQGVRDRWVSCLWRVLGVSPAQVGHIPGHTGLKYENWSLAPNRLRNAA